jgi:hypothetical protein
MIINEFHKKMGHINHDNLHEMVKKQLVTGINLDLESKAEFCEMCTKAKATCKTFPKKTTSEYRKYSDKIVSDVWGPATVESLGMKKYIVTYKDLHTREEKAYYLQQKSEVLGTYKKYEAWARTQHDARIKIFGSDRGGEFTGKEFSEHLENAGTICHLTVHDSPASNGIAERSNRTLIEGTRALLQGSRLPQNLWAEAHNHFVWLRNRVSTRATPNGKTPYEMVTSNKPDLSITQEFRTTAWVKKIDVGKLEPWAEEGRFLGFNEEAKGYRIYWPKKRNVTIEHDIQFNGNQTLQPTTEHVQFEGEMGPITKPTRTLAQTIHQNVANDQKKNGQTTKPLNKTTKGQRPENLIENNENAPHDDENPSDSPQDAPTTPPRPKTTRQNSLKGLPQYNQTMYSRGQRRRGNNLSNTASIVNTAPDLNALVTGHEANPEPGGANANTPEWFHEAMVFAMAVTEDEPKLQEALEGNEWQEWRDAIETKLTQIEALKTWELVVPPPNANIIPSMYTFHRKRDEHGRIIHYKARLVTKGYKQQFRIDYTETYAPTVRPATLCILLSLAAQNDALIHQADAVRATPRSGHSGLLRVGFSRSDYSESDWQVGLRSGPYVNVLAEGILSYINKTTQSVLT